MNYQQLFREIVTILRRDYAGKDIMDDRFYPRYYTQAIGQAWNDSRLDDLLFLRYVSQMLACIGDRNLRLELRPSDDYIPSGPGFFTRRYEDALYITAVTGESELCVGDRILAINGGTPAKHKALIQKDFFRGSVPEREDWNGLLKMADFIDILRPDGTKAQVMLKHHPLAAPVLTPACEPMETGTVYLRPGPFDGTWSAAEFLKEHAGTLSDASALILDLRNGRGEAEEEILPLLPYLCREDTALSQLLDDTIVVNHSRLNCILKAAALADIPEAQEYIRELTAKAGTGFTAESLGEDEFLSAQASASVVVLTDTWCRDAAETLVLAAQRAGVSRIGRPTLGTIRTCAPVSFELDDRYTLTWPTALSSEAYENRSIRSEGIQPDVYIPWTPEECTRDLVLEAALAHINN